MNLIKLLILIFAVSCSMSPQKNADHSFNYISGSSISDISYDVEIINTKKQKWSNNQRYIFYLDNGKVFKTYGLENNIEIINIDNIEIQSLKEGEVLNSSAKIKFTNPETNYLNIFYEYKIVSFANYPKYQDQDSYLVEEKYNIPLIRWSGKNYFLFDKQTKAIKKSTQKLAPFSRKIYIVHKKIAA
tara:strand:+ start:440 stop:1000 length:561 start_codon:yes stop_codon:yes gene_type:complete